MDPLTL